MRAPGFLHLYSILFLLTTLTSAWPWPKWLPELDSLVVRQDGGDSSSTSITVVKPTKTDDSSSPAETGSGESTTIKSAKNTNTASQTGKTTSQPSGTAKPPATTKKPTSSVFDPRLPAGGVSMLSPGPLDGAQYYKIGQPVVFAWNYTSLLATPTAVNVVATCTANQQLYTIAANQTVGNATGAVTWDTGAYQQTALSAPLLTETYTLIIYDAQSSISATAQAGYLAVFNQYTFGMYTPAPYTPLNEGFICATCSGALGDMEKRALGMVIGVSVITVLSFTWFVGGTGIIW